MKLSHLLKGFPGHPLHPPLTDATIGAYTLSAILAVLSVLGVSEENTAHGWWLALVVGLVISVPTALTGLVEWLSITRGTPLFRTATSHMLAMVTATVLFGIAALVGHSGYADGEVNAAGLVLTVGGWLMLTLGGWLGGAVVFVHGMRVLNLVEEPAARAAMPLTEEKKRAESS